MNKVRNSFSVTFEIITPESAEHGEADARGFISTGQSLRDALEDLDAYGCWLHASNSDIDNARWFTAHEVNQGTRDYFETGAVENRSIHIPDGITPSSRVRVARLLHSLNR